MKKNIETLILITVNLKENLLETFIGRIRPVTAESLEWKRFPEDEKDEIEEEWRRS
jgi:hypothetical protein